MLYLIASIVFALIALYVLIDMIVTASNARETLRVTEIKARDGGRFIGGVDRPGDN